MLRRSSARWGDRDPRRTARLRRESVLHQRGRSVQDFVALVGGDAGTGVGYRDDILIAFFAAGYRDGAAGRGVLDGVIEEIEQKAAKEGFVGDDGEFFGDVGVKFDLFGKSEGTGAAENVGGEFIEIEFVLRERILAGVGAREGKEVFNDVREALGFFAEDGEGFAVFGG